MLTDDEKAEEHAIYMLLSPLARHSVDYATDAYGALREVFHNNPEKRMLTLEMMVIMFALDISNGDVVTVRKVINKMHEHMLNVVLAEAKPGARDPKQG